ncbi:hypothetical protein FDO65_18565 [Nakamurella flava]|uniref:Uncharacterized protein n=1 Tax=Nakamurella flava TaxID=2576308 RepID=A0A4U6QA63_9ACTN|nr:hypothetical protein [Nakamurella flava]TKV56847.1 hypothetical protein FDO65_18565 [Nakamurella flava]
MSAAEWTPLATGLVAAVALLVGVLTVRQKSVSDRRAQWWERVQWAVEQTLHESEERRLIGVVVLTELIDTDQPTRDEVRIIDALADVLLAESAQNEDHGDQAAATAEES